MQARPLFFTSCKWASIQGAWGCDRDVAYHREQLRILQTQEYLIWCLGLGRPGEIENGMEQLLPRHRCKQLITTGCYLCSRFIWRRKYYSFENGAIQRAAAPRHEACACACARQQARSSNQQISLLNLRYIHPSFYSKQWVENLGIVRLNLGNLCTDWRRARRRNGLAYWKITD